MTTGEESIIGIFLGCLFYMFIYALIFVRWAHITNFKAGFRGGLTLGLLYALTWQFFPYNGDRLPTFIDKRCSCGSTIIAAIGAGAVAFIQKKMA